MLDDEKRNLECCNQIIELWFQFANQYLLAYGIYQSSKLRKTMFLSFFLFDLKGYVSCFLKGGNPLTSTDTEDCHLVGFIKCYIIFSRKQWI